MGQRAAAGLSARSLRYQRDAASHQPLTWPECSVWDIQTFVHNKTTKYGGGVKLGPTYRVPVESGRLSLCWWRLTVHGHSRLLQQLMEDRWNDGTLLHHPTLQPITSVTCFTSALSTPRFLDDAVKGRGHRENAWSHHKWQWPALGAVQVPDWPTAGTGAGTNMNCALLYFHLLTDLV